MSKLFRPLDWPIATKLVVAFLLISLIPIVVISVINQSQARQGLLLEAQRNLQNVNTSSSDKIYKLVNDQINEVNQVAGNESIVTFMDAAKNRPVELGPNFQPQVQTLTLLRNRAAAGTFGNAYYFVADGQGRVILTSDVGGEIPSNELREIGEQTYFKEGLKVNGYLTEPVLTQIQPNYVAYYYITTAIRNPRNFELLGVLGLRVTMRPIWDIVESDLGKAGDGSYGLLVDRLNIVLADSRTKGNPTAQSQFLFNILRQLNTVGGEGSRAQYLQTGRFPDSFDFGAKQVPMPSIGQYAAAPTVDRNNPFFEFNFGNNNLQANYNRLLNPAWTYFVVVPESTYAAAANNITLIALIVGLIVAIIVILLAIVLTRVLTTPVREIGRVLTFIGMGDFDARVNVRSQDELGRLGETLNAMFDNTLTLIQTREEKEELQGRIMSLLEEIGTVAEGDLTVKAEVTADITGAIADSFNLMTEELRKTILNIKSATIQTSTLLDDMLVNANRTEQVLGAQATRILSSTTAIGEMDRSIQQVSSSATQSAQVAEIARNNAREGGLAVAKSINSMNRIRGNVQETAKKIKRLGESSQQIGEIVKIIDDIADQTNMLALNAAIQATMAGEQGKGFSVVAEEVRRLAERSANSTREIASLVKSIQDDTTEAVVAMEESTREVVDGSKVADDAGKALAAIENVVNQLANLITNISKVSQQQAQNSSSIAQTMVEIEGLTKEATVLRQKSTETVEMVAQTAQELNESVKAFKVEREESGSYVVPDEYDNLWQPPVQPNYAQYTEMPTRPPVPPVGISLDNLVAAVDEYEVARSNESRPPVGNGEAVPGFLAHRQAHNAANGGIYQKEDEDLDIQKLLSEDADLFDSMINEVGTGRGNPKDKTGGLRPPTPPALG